jgi:hypothetical protein
MNKEITCPPAPKKGWLSTYNNETNTSSLKRKNEEIYS